MRWDTRPDTAPLPSPRVPHKYDPHPEFCSGESKMIGIGREIVLNSINCVPGTCLCQQPADVSSEELPRVRTECRPS